jgi:hypothetical protein
MMTDHEHAMLQAINAARVERGLHALAADDQLAAAAQRHARDMAYHPGLVHEGSDGSTIGQRIADAGYVAARYGEIVAWGWQGRVDGPVTWWLASPDHVGYLLSAEYSDIGVGHATGLGPWQHYWAVDMGRRRVAAPPPPEPPPVPRPRPYTSHVPVAVFGAPVPAPGIDLLPYLQGDGRAYRVGNQRGTFEVFQTQTEGDTFFQVKAWDDLSVVHWEGFTVTPEHIGRDVDTSPGGGRFYRQFAAPWVKRRMRVGESFSAEKRIQFYKIADCSQISDFSGTVTDTITLLEHLDEWRSPFGVAVPDVVVLRWEQGGEVYRFGRGYGLVGWQRAHDDPHSPVWSAISEMRPDVGKLNRLRIPCLE